MRAIQDTAAFFFIVAVVILGAVSIFGVWEIFDQDVVGKSFMTLGLLSVIAVIILAAGKFIDNKSEAQALVIPNPAFGSVRRMMLGVLIVSASLLALVGVLVIWDVIAEGEILWKSLGSIAIIAFSSFLVVMTCREREMVMSGDVHKRNMSLGTIILLVLIGGWFLMSFSRFFY
ncbi:MAG: hypothetical protein Q7S34_01455 [bacterium]|nr:hypothetical protein [bacterium]